MDTAVACYQTRRMPKEGLVMGHCLQSLSMLIGMFQDLVARHQASLHFIQNDLATKLDQCASFMTRDGTGMRLKEAEHFLLGSHLLALQHPQARLSNDALHQREHLLHLREQALDGWLGLLTQERHHLLTLPH